MEKIDFPEDKVKEFLSVTRKSLIKGILANPKDNLELWNFAHKIIKLEQESVWFYPDNWSAILEK